MRRRHQHPMHLRHHPLIQALRHLRIPLTAMPRLLAERAVEAATASAVPMEEMREQALMAAAQRLTEAPQTLQEVRVAMAAPVARLIPALPVIVRPAARAAMRVHKVKV